MEALQTHYRAYQAASKRTRFVLEKNLQEVEQSLIEMGAPPAAGAPGPGYRKEAESTPPPSMKTDFRA